MTGTWRYLLAVLLTAGAAGCRPDGSPVAGTPPEAGTAARPRPGQMVLVSAEPVWDSLWPEPSADVEKAGIVLTYADLAYMGTEGTQRPTGPSPHWLFVLSNRPFEASRYAVLRIRIEGAESIGFWWARAEDRPADGLLLDPARYVRVQAAASGIFDIDLTGHPEWRGAIGLFRIDPHIHRGTTVNLRGVDAWRGSGDWVAAQAPGPVRLELSAADNALGALACAAATDDGSGVRQSLDLMKDKPWPDSVFPFVQSTSFRLVESAVRQGRREEALAVLSAAARTSPNPVEYLADAAESLSQETATALWPKDPFVVLAEFGTAGPNVSIWTNTAWRRIDPAAIEQNAGPDGGPCLRIAYGPATAAGDTMLGVPVRVPLTDRIVGFRAYLRSEKPVDGLSFILCARYPVEDASGWLGRSRSEPIENGWIECSRQDNFLRSAALLTKQDVGALQDALVSAVLIPLMGGDNTLFVGRIELYLPADD